MGFFILYMAIQLKITGDGSHTLYNEELDETYHSTHGALQESLHVFIKHGLHFSEQKNIALNILEVGFGTGLNAYLTILHKFPSTQIKYVSLETNFLKEEILESLNYTAQADEKQKQIFRQIHQAPINTLTEITNEVKLLKLYSSLQEFSSSEVFDLIYYDAFGPRVQPEMWTEEIMLKVFKLLKPGGFLVTYCSQGQFKRNLKAAGFLIEELPGPPGKRQMTRAFKK